MTLPTTLTPARRAIEHALTKATSGTFALSKTGPLFQLLAPAEAAKRAASIASNPGVLVGVFATGDEPEPSFFEGSDRQRFAVLIQLVCSYWSGSPNITSETDRALEQIERDTPRIYAALTETGVLDRDPSGAETGFDSGGGVSRLAGGTSGPEPWPMKAGDARVFTVTHRFSAAVELTKPTTPA